MEQLIAASFRAVRSLFAPGMFGIFIFSVIVTIAVLIGFTAVCGVFFSFLAVHLHNFFLPFLGTLGAGLLAWFLFPGIMPVIISFFDNRIVHIIETEDYPASLPSREPEFLPELWHDTKFSLIMIVLNIIVLPLYLVPVLNLFLFYLLNGYLLGREFFVMAARRHVSAVQGEVLRKRHARVVMTGGVMLTLLATIPIVNLIAPFWGIALMTHLYHKLAATPNSEFLIQK